MATRTLSIIKPDAVAKNKIGEILTRFENAGLRIIAAKMLTLTREQAGAFYAVHRERPFFDDLVGFMVSGAVMVQVLEGEDAVAVNRRLMGATDPKNAEAGTIRADFADNVEENAVHGSDSPENAAVEIEFFFPGTGGEIIVATKRHPFLSPPGQCIEIFTGGGELRLLSRAHTPAADVAAVEDEEDGMAGIAACLNADGKCIRLSSCLTGGEGGDADDAPAYVLDEEEEEELMEALNLTPFFKR